MKGPYNRDGDSTPPEEIESVRGFLSEGGLPEADLDTPLRATESEARPELSENNLTGDSYDVRLFSELVEASGELSALLGPEDGNASPTFGPLMEDFFRAFYKLDFSHSRRKRVGYARHRNPPKKR